MCKEKNIDKLFNEFNVKFDSLFSKFKNEIDFDEINREIESNFKNTNEMDVLHGILHITNKIAKKSDTVSLVYMNFQMELIKLR